MTDYKKAFEEIVARVSLLHKNKKTEAEAKEKVEDLRRLIAITNNMTGVSFVNVSEYNSDVSNNTEVSSRLINVGVDYDNMLMNDMMLLANCDINTLDVNKFNYDGIDWTKFATSLNEYKTLVRAELHTALKEMSTPPTEKEDYTPRENNDVWINKILVFNVKTLRASIRGNEINKVVIEKGEFKKVASAPLTIAKVIIKKQLEFKTDKIKRLALDNMKEVRLQGETVMIGGGKKEAVQHTEQNTGVRYEPVNEPEKAG